MRTSKTPQSNHGCLVDTLPEQKHWSWKKRLRGPATGILCAFASVSSCSTYQTLRAGDGILDHSIRKSTTTASVRTPEHRDETVGTYGVPYYLPKALLHLTVVPVSKAGTLPPPLSTPAKSTQPPAAGQAVTGGGGGDKGVTSSGGHSANPLVDALAAHVGETPPAPAIPAAPGPAAPANTFVAVTSQYVINLETRIVPDIANGPLYAHYFPNWLYSEDVTVGVNGKQLLSTLDATSSDRTAQVIFNLADTAANVAKFLEGGGLDVFAAQDFSKRTEVANKEQARSVIYKKLNIDVTFDPFDPLQVERLAGLFTDTYTSSTVYISPFRISLKDPSSQGVVLANKTPGVRRGLYFREPTILELAIVGREKRFINVLANELDRTPADAVGRDELLAQLKLARTNSGDHTEQFVIVAPNKQRSYSYNIARSAFVQSKKTALTISDGQLTQSHLTKPSEAEGLSEIPLKLSEKLAALPKDLLTLRKEIIQGQTAVSTEQLNGFNAEESLRNAVASRNLTEDSARLKAQSDTVKARSVLIDSETGLINSDLSNQTTADNVDLKTRIAQLEAQTALLKAIAARKEAEQALKTPAKQ